MILAYKAFYPGLKGQGSFQYEVGKTYTSHNDGIGRHGFHAALDPVFCLGFISPSRGGVYGEVEIDGAIDRGGVISDDGRGQYTAVTGESIRILRTLGVEQMLLRAVNYRSLKGEEEGRVQRTSDSLYGVSRNADRCGVCVADMEGSSASAFGEWGCALSQAEGCTVHADGPNGIAAALHDGCWASASRNAWILLADWHDPSSFAYVTSAQPDTLYALVDGKITTKKD